jgi:hypothetical protein
MAEKVMTTLASEEAVQGIVSPDLAEMKGELKALNSKVEANNVKIDSFRSELKADIRSVDTKVEQVVKTLDIDRRMFIMEAELKELKKRS